MVSRIAQSDDKGGTWAGVLDGLKKNRPIYVRYPDAKEKNANLLIIQKGASAVDIFGKALTLSPNEQKTPEQLEKDALDSKIIAVLKNVEMISTKEIISKLHIDWRDDKMKRYLEKMSQVEKKKIKNRIYYNLKGKVQRELF